MLNITCIFKAQANVQFSAESITNVNDCVVFTKASSTDRNFNEICAIFNRSNDPNKLTFDKKDLHMLTVSL